MQYANKDTAIKIGKNDANSLPTKRYDFFNKNEI
jgi:hypothetical protein